MKWRVYWLTYSSILFVYLFIQMACILTANSPILLIYLFNNLCWQLIHPFYFFIYLIVYSKDGYIDTSFTHFIYLMIQMVCILTAHSPILLVYLFNRLFKRRVYWYLIHTFYLFNDSNGVYIDTSFTHFFIYANGYVDSPFTHFI